MTGWPPFHCRRRMAQPEGIFTTAAHALAKQALEESMLNDLDGQLDLERDLQAEAAATPDHAEGLRAFLENRRPSWSPGPDA